MKLFIWLKKNFTKSLPLATAVLLLLVFTRSIETYLINENQYIENLSGLFFSGLLNDLIFSLILLLILSITPWHRSKFIKRTVVLILGLLLTIGLISSFYFTISLQLLDRTIYQFSVDQLLDIIQTFGTFKWYYLLILAPIPALFFFYSLLRKVSKKITHLSFFLLIFLCSIIFKKKPEMNFEKIATKNKVSYYLGDTFSYFFAPQNTYRGKEIKAINEYPLLRKWDTKNLLGKHISLKEDPPNIVLIIVESLSSSFSGPLANEISFTPFLDSLAQHSIYLNNFIATSERTFGVLPSSLASLPHGEKGISSLQLNIPNHQSILSILINNGYNGSFFYGGDSNFDNMKVFMENNGVNSIVDHKSYHIELGERKDTDPYGKSDQLFFKEAVANWQNKIIPPFIHTYLSLSMHHPFKVENQSKYIEKAEAIIDEKADSKSVKKYKKHLQVFSTSLYTDDAIRMLIKSYSKEKSYSNTIFFIYGDHMFGTIPKNNLLEKYRTPLYIFSPLINKPKVVNAINSHLDLPPTIIGLLKDNFKLNLPDETHWIGEPLNLSNSVVKNRKVALMKNSREAEEFLFNDWFLPKDRLYKIDDQMNLKLESNEQIKDSIRQIRDSMIYVQNLAIRNNKLIKSNANQEKINTLNIYNEEFTQNIEYYNIIKHRLTDDINSLEVKINLALSHQLDTTFKRKPLLCLSIRDKDNKPVYWNEFYYEFDETNSFLIQLSTFFKSNSEIQLKKGAVIKLYFWNREASSSEFIINNGLIELSAAK
jgi:uncharacterized sulfatase